MLKKLKKLSVTLASLLLIGVPVLAPVTVSGQTIKDNLCSGVDTATGEATGTCATDADDQGTVNKWITTIIKYFSIIVGAASVIMIIYGGFKYITSGGNDSNVSGAKNTILYAVIGLIVVALAQVIVRFVLTQAKV